MAKPDVLKLDTEMNVDTTYTAPEATYTVDEAAFAGGQGLDPLTQDVFEAVFEYGPMAAAFGLGYKAPQILKGVKNQAPKLWNRMKNLLTKDKKYLTEADDKVIKDFQKILDKKDVQVGKYDFEEGMRQGKKRIEEIKLAKEARRIEKKYARKKFQKEAERIGPQLGINPRPDFQIVLNKLSENRMNPNVLKVAKRDFEVYEKLKKSNLGFESRGHAQDVIGKWLEKEGITDPRVIKKWDDYINAHFPRPFPFEPFKGARVNLTAFPTPTQLSEVTPATMKSVERLKGKIAGAPGGSKDPFSVGNMISDDALRHMQDIASDKMIWPSIATIFGTYEGVKHLTTDPKDPSGGEWYPPQSLPTPYEPGMSQTDSLMQNMEDMVPMNIAPAPKFDPLSIIQNMTAEDEIF